MTKRTWTVGSHFYRNNKHFEVVSILEEPNTGLAVLEVDHGPRVSVPFELIDASLEADRLREGIESANSHYDLGLMSEALTKLLDGGK